MYKPTPKILQTTYEYVSDGLELLFQLPKDLAVYTCGKGVVVEMYEEYL